LRLETAADVFATSRCRFHCAPRGPECRRIFGRAWPATIGSVIHLCCIGRVAERLDHLLGSKRLVRRAGRVYLAAVGVVDRGTGPRPEEIALALSLARTIRLSAHRRRFSLHGLDVSAGSRLFGATRRIRGKDG